MKIEVRRGPKSKKIDVWRRLGGSWRVLGRLGVLWCDFGRFFWRHWGEDRRNMGQVGAKLAASCAQDGHVSAKMAMLGSVWEALDEFWEHFLEHFGRCAGYQKTLKKQLFFKSFSRFWGGWMAWLGHLGG